MMIYPRHDRGHAEVADHYDELDSIYRRLWGEHVHHGLWRTGNETPREAVNALSDLVGERLSFAPQDRLVDIGCGYGATARRFADRGAIVTGLTLSRAQWGAAEPHPEVTLHCRDWLANGLPTMAFDGAYAIESSEHILDKPLFFSEARRVFALGSPMSARRTGSANICSNRSAMKAACPRWAARRSIGRWPSGLVSHASTMRISRKR